MLVAPGGWESLTTARDHTAGSIFAPIRPPAAGLDRTHLPSITHSGFEAAELIPEDTFNYTVYARTHVSNTVYLKNQPLAFLKHAVCEKIKKRWESPDERVNHVLQESPESAKGLV